MKYYEITKAQADSIGIYKIDDQNYIDPHSGRLVNGNFGITKSCLMGMTEINGVDFSTMTEKNVEFEIYPI